MIEQVHKSDFELGINFIFDGFDLNDYEIFSTALSNYIMKKITNSNLIIPGVEGMIKLRKEEWIELIGSLCDLTSGSGDKGTPIVLVQGYFDNFTD